MPMSLTRRQFLLAAGCTLCAPAIRATPARPRAIVIGGGWGGLAAARHLAERCEVLLVERQAAFVSQALGNRWLAGLDDGRRLHQDYRAAADALGYRFVQAEVLAIEREQRQVVTTAGTFPYDWLVVSAGIGEDDAALFDGDAAAARQTRQLFPSAYTAGSELAALQHKLGEFAGGEFLMSIPLAPYRCPPAPYE